MGTGKPGQDFSDPGMKLRPGDCQLKFDTFLLTIYESGPTATVSDSDTVVVGRQWNTKNRSYFV